MSYFYSDSVVILLGILKFLVVQVSKLFVIKVCITYIIFSAAHGQYTIFPYALTVIKSSVVRSTVAKVAVQTQGLNGANQAENDIRSALIS